MSKKGKLILAISVLVVVLILEFSYWLLFEGGLQMFADYVAPRTTYWSLTEGTALSGQEIGEYLHDYNPNIPVEAGNKMSEVCKKFDVNPAFALGIAKADSNHGLAGVGMRHKNPGNTKISYSMLEANGIGHASYRAGQNFAAFDNWGDGYAAICLTLGNYRYYNMRGSMDAILRTYAGNPSPNYYGGVRAVMNGLLSNITIGGTIYEDGTANEIKIESAEVILKNADGTIASVIGTDANGFFHFGTLPRNHYTIEVKKTDYLPVIYQLNAPHQKNNLEMTLVLNDDVRDYDQPLLANHGYIRGKVVRFIDPLGEDRLTIKAKNVASGTEYDTMTNGEDEFMFYNIPKGKYQLRIKGQSIKKEGFLYTKEIQMRKNDAAVEGVEFYF